MKPHSFRRNKSSLPWPQCFLGRCCARSPPPPLRRRLALGGRPRRASLSPRTSGPRCWRSTWAAKTLAWHWLVEAPEVWPLGMESCAASEKQDSNGQQWTAMDSNGQQWTAMDSNGQQWTAMDSMSHGLIHINLFLKAKVMDLSEASEAAQTLDIVPCFSQTTLCLPAG